MQLFEMQGLLAGKCLPGDMKVNESLAEYLLRKLEDRNELERQLSAKTISEQNIINAFGIKGEGAHSKLVIEYVHGLVAENEAMKDINAWCRTDAFQNMYREFKIAEAAGCDVIDCMHDAMLTAIMHAPATPKTDAFTAELRAQGLEHLANICKYLGDDERDACTDYVGRQCEISAANLRAGRKG
ncbi:ead/Ea22-like family protein [Rahnella bonaserana]|uniref:ead/Ea22-like family protein n=1 Tax=Rahnella bonaserana TaxID=2816248 RepID=UPI00320B50BF